MQETSINAKQDEIIEAFAMLDGDVEMANFYMMELGQKLAPLPDGDKVDENVVKGCQSKVWLKTDMDQVVLSTAPTAIPRLRKVW